MLARISNALVFSFLVTFVGTAHAGSVPYADWAFDVRRAKDDAAFEQLVKKRPEFAKVYFFGQVFDLVTEGIPDKRKAQLKPYTLSEELWTQASGQAQVYTSSYWTGKKHLTRLRTQAYTTHWNE